MLKLYDHSSSLTADGYGLRQLTIRRGIDYTFSQVYNSLS